MLRPSHKDDFLERTKAAREERQMEKIRGKEWRTQMVFKWLFIGLKQDSFPKKTCSSVVLRSRSFFDKLQFFSPAPLKMRLSTILNKILLPRPPPYHKKDY